MNVDIKTLGIGAAAAGAAFFAWPHIKARLAPKDSITVEIPLQNGAPLNTGITPPNQQAPLVQGIAGLFQSGIDQVRLAREQAAAKGKNTQQVDDFLAIIGGPQTA